MSEIKIQSVVVPPLYSNCYIVSNENKNAVVVDPGGIPDEIFKVITEAGLKVQAILNTHGHIDHISGNPQLRRLSGAPVYVHAIDAPLLSSAILSGAKWAGHEFEEHEPDHHISHTEKLVVGDFTFNVYHTPGHSPGSVCLVMPEHKVVFSGDVVFMDSIGRSDLPGGDPAVLNESLRWFLTLPDDYTVLPGHGAPTTVGRERERNPFLRRL